MLFAFPSLGTVVYNKHIFLYPYMSTLSLLCALSLARLMEGIFFIFCCSRTMDQIDFYFRFFCNITVRFQLFPSKAQDEKSLSVKKSYGRLFDLPMQFNASEAKWGGKAKQLSLAFLEYAWIPVGNDVKSAYAIMMSAFIYQLGSPPSMLLLEFHIQIMYFHFLIEVFFIHFLARGGK